MRERSAVALAAENERLRAALRAVRDLNGGDERWSGSTPARTRRIAEEALEEEQR
jgi:hypothetical protein